MSGDNMLASPAVALKHALFYSPYFHPEIENNYSVRVALDPAACGDRRIMPQNYEEIPQTIAIR